MASKISPKDFERHDRVAYIPNHADGNIKHPDVEYGYVTSIGTNNVFVKFDTQINKLGFDNCTAQACYPHNLKLCLE
jgi:hypothetical protein